MGKRHIGKIISRLSKIFRRRRVLSSDKELSICKEDREKISELSKCEDNHLKKAIQIDKKICAIQQSTRTTIPQLVHLHNYLRMNLKWYYTWHLWRGANYVHVAAMFLIVFTIFLSFFSWQSSKISHATTNINIAGRCFTTVPSQSQICSAGQTVRVAINGVLSGTTATTSGNPSVFTFTNLAVNAGDVLTFYKTGVTDEHRAVSVVKVAALPVNIGVDLSEQWLTLHGLTQITNADLALYDNSVAATDDVYFEVDSSSNLTIPAGGTAYTSQTFNVLSTYRPSSTGSVTVTTPAIYISQTITADANTFVITGAGTTYDWFDSSNRYSAGTSTVKFTAARDLSIYSGIFNNLEIIPGVITDNGYVVSGAGDASCNGVYRVNGAFNGKNLYDLIGSGACQFRWSGSVWEIVGIDSETGDPYPLYRGTGANLPASPWNNNPGGTAPAPTVAARATVTYTLGSAIIVNGYFLNGDGIHNSIFDNSASNWGLAFNGNVTNSANATLVAGTSISSVIKGNFTNSGTFTDSGGTITLSGTGAQTITMGGTDANHDFTNLKVTNASASGVSFADSVAVIGTFTAITANTKLKFTAGSTYSFANININGQATGTRVQLTSLTPGTQYRLNVTQVSPTASNVTVTDSNSSGGNAIIATTNGNSGGGCTNWTFTGSVTNPGAPTAASAAAGDASAAISFTAPVSNGGSAITGYTVTSTPGSLTGTGASSPVTVSGLTNGVSYTFTVHATNAIGHSIESSATGSVMPMAVATVPGAPTGAVATRGNTTASVAFSAPASDGGSAITGYTVTSTPGSFTGTGASSPIIVNGLTNGTSYTFTVHATNAIGNSAESSASVAVTPATTPAAPTIGTATPGNSSASVAFSAPGSNGGSAITGYTVTSSPGGLTGTGASSPVTVSGLTNGTAYTFTVHATNAIGDSSESSSSNSTTPATVPGAPTGAVATRGDASVSVSFTAPVSNGGSAITGYTVTSTPGSFTGTGVSSPIIVSGLTNGTAYTFTVRATNAVGDSIESSSSNSTTPMTTPGVPTAVSAIAGNSQATVSFTAPVSNGGSAITGYTVTSTPGSISGTGTSSPITVSGLTNGTAYTFTVYATNVAGNSSLSSATSSITPTAPAAPAATTEPTTTTETPDTQAPVIKISAPSTTNINQEVYADATGSTDNVGIASFEWNFGDGSTATGIKVAHKYSTPNIRTISLVVSDKAGNKSSKSQTITIVPPTPQITDIKVVDRIINIKGTAYPFSLVKLTIHSDPFTVETQADKDGVWSVAIDTKENNISLDNHRLVLSSSVGSLVSQTQAADSNSSQTPIASEDKTYNINLSDNGGQLVNEIKTLKRGNNNLIIVALLLATLAMSMVFVKLRKANRKK